MTVFRSSALTGAGSGAGGASSIGASTRSARQVVLQAAHRTVRPAGPNWASSIAYCVVHDGQLRIMVWRIDAKTRYERKVPGRLTLNAETVNN